jgi:hypothetical protein
VPVSSRGLALLAVASSAVALSACSGSGGPGVAVSPSASASAAASGTSPASAPATTPGSASASGTASAPGAAGATGAAGASGTAGATAGGTQAAATVLPSGYARVGGSAQGISVAIPADWVTVDLSKAPTGGAAGQLKVPGLSAADLTADIAELEKVHAVFAADTAKDAQPSKDQPSKEHYTRNLSAYCGDSGVTESGRAGLADLASSARSEFTSVASNITQTDLMVGNVPGLETSYQQHSGTLGTLYGSQLEVLPKPGQVCSVTLTAVTPQPNSPILAVAALTAQFF